MIVYDCRHPGCGKTFHSSDAVRKHARKQHVNWLRRIDEEASLTRLMHRTEQYSAKRMVLRSEHEAAAQRTGWHAEPAVRERRAVGPLHRESGRAAAATAAAAASCLLRFIMTP